MIKFNKDQHYWVSAYCTDEFLSIETYSGLGMIGRDTKFPSHLFPADANDQIVGEAILQALSDSRTLNSLEERVLFFDLKRGKEQYADWIAMLMEKYGYKTKKALFKGMKKCGLHLINDQITIRPSFHEKLEAWSGDRIEESDYVILSVDSSLTEIGAGLRLALSRCKG